MNSRNYTGLPIKKYLTIGSFAMYAATHNAQICFNAVKDIDVICYEKDLEKGIVFESKDEYSGVFLHKGKPIECLFADKQESLQKILDKYKEPTVELLLEIKLGHIIFPGKNWTKHMQHIGELQGLIRNSIKPTPLDWELIKLHRKCTRERKNLKGTPKLNGVTKEKFFDDKVVKHFVHDDIHDWMAHYNEPLFKRMQPDPALVECSKDLWEKNFSFTDKLLCVLEEAYVIALERHMIPQLVDGALGISAYNAFQWALMRICTTLCVGFFREFAIENYNKLLENYDHDYVKNFLKKANYSLK